jgi:CrcB protein
MGFLFVLFTDRLSDSAVLRAGILIGVLGGFTTFSTFSIEAFNLIEQGEPLKALVYMLASLILCVAGTWLGVIIGRQL